MRSEAFLRSPLLFMCISEGIMTELVKVLLIEDNSAQARILQEMVSDCGPDQFILVHVQRLQSALERLAQESFDVILLDLNLPDSQGLASLEQLCHQCSEVPIVVLSNSSDPQLALAVKEHGAQEYLVKRHMTSQGLAQVLRRSLGEISA
jgi:CheY-like chemotaxis protein